MICRHIGKGEAEGREVAPVKTVFISAGWIKSMYAQIHRRGATGFIKISKLFKDYLHSSYKSCIFVLQKQSTQSTIFAVARIR